MTFLRGTVHLVTADDCLALRPVLQPVLERLLKATPFSRQIAGVDVDALMDLGRERLSSRAMNGNELRAAVAERWPEYDAASLRYAIHYTLPLVQVPPRGVWGKSGQARWQMANSWLGRPLGTETRPDTMIRRYLAAFGPATAADVRTWSGLAGAREILDRIPDLRRFRDEQGRELFDVPDGPLPDPDTPAPPRFLPEYDNVSLSHDDRSRIVSAGDRQRLAAVFTVGTGALLVDGFAGGIWRVARHDGTATLTVRLLGRVSAVDHDAISAEAEQLLGFLAADVRQRRIEIDGGIDP